MPRNNKLNLNAKKLAKAVNGENVIICVLVLVLVVLVVNYVYQNNREGFNSEKPVLLLFYVDWCPHCTNAKPIVENIKESNNSVSVKLVNCEGSDEEKQLAKENNVRAYPTVVLNKVNGDTVEYDRGVSEKGLNDFIIANL